MRGIWAPEDPWATWPQRALRRVAHTAVEIGLAVLATVVFAFGWIFVNEYRLESIQRQWIVVAKDLLARHATRRDTMKTLASFRNARVYELDPNSRPDVPDPAIIAIDPSEFTFVLSTAHAETLIFLDPYGRAKAYRVKGGGSSL